MALKSSSTIENGRPDWKVPTPAICQPSTHRLPVNGRSQIQLMISRCLRWKSESPRFR